MGNCIENEIIMEWIKIEDRLPENDEEVLIAYWHIPDHERYEPDWIIETGRHLDGQWVQLQGENITHWMPLPNPPEEKK